MSDPTYATNMLPSGGALASHIDDDQETTARKKAKLQERSFPIFPAGKKSYPAINSDPRMFYVDKTSFIPSLERMCDSGDVVLLLAPRRVGKSLLLSTLACYYNISRANTFEVDFGKRWIGQVDEFDLNGLKEAVPRKTPLANKFYVLRLDFSGVSQPTYRHVLDFQMMILIDEYDSFLNSVIGNKEFVPDPEELKKMEYTFKAFFANVKARLGPNLWVFIAGVTPMALSMYTTGFNVGFSNLQRPTCANLFGFTQSDVEKGLDLLSLGSDRGSILSIMKELHNGYKFHPRSNTTLFNPARVQFMLSTIADIMQTSEGLEGLQLEVSNMADPSTRSAESALALVPANPHTLKIVTDCLNHPDGSLSTMRKIDQIRPESMSNVEQQGIIAWLFINGALTYAAPSPTGLLSFKIPNQVAREDFIGRFLRMDRYTVSDEYAQMQASLWSFLDDDEPNIDPFLAAVESTVLSSTQGRYMTDLEVDIHKVLFTCFNLCKRPLDQVVSEYAVKGNTVVDIVYHSFSEKGKKRFVFELKNVPVGYWLPNPKSTNWHALAKLSLTVRRDQMPEADLYKHKWHPQDTTVQQTITDASEQLGGYLEGMKERDKEEGPSIGFVIVRVGLFRLVSRRVAT